MPNPIMNQLFKRQTLDQILTYPKEITSVYIVENHIWKENGKQESRQKRLAETKTVDEFLINPVRSFLNDILKQMAAPYQPDRKDLTIGQGYWIQADFGSGKSHLLSFLGAIGIGDDSIWKKIKEKEEKAGMGKRESIYSFYENGLKRKNETTKGILVAVKTLVGSGSGGVGLENADKSLTAHILDAVSEQFRLETGRSLPIYPTQILAKRFLEQDYARYKDDLKAYLANPKYFDEEEQEDLSDFINDLSSSDDPSIQRDCGQKLWNFYKDYLEITPNIPVESEEVLRNMVEQILAEGYAGLFLILDEVSLYMKQRSDQQRAEDEQALVVMSNRLTRHHNFPVWTVCAAQQAIESKSAGSKNIIARERLDLVPLLKNDDDYYSIALARVREITQKNAIDQYYQDYKHGFTWVETHGKDQFSEFFPFYRNSMDVLRAVSFNLTTVRSALYFMLETVKRQSKKQSNELISLWSMFDEVVSYEEDPSGVNRSIANIQTKFPQEWKAYEQAKRQISSATKGYLKTFPARCEKITKTLFLEYIAKTAEKGLTAEEIMNAVMEWKDHESGQASDKNDNLDHYEILLDSLQRELVQIEEVNGLYRFNPAGASGISPKDEFAKFRAEAENNEKDRFDAWKFLLSMNEWLLRTPTMVLDLSAGAVSLFSELPVDSNSSLNIAWHKRGIKGRLLMRDLNHLPQGALSLPNINSEETGEDFMVFISSSPAEENTKTIIQQKKDPRLLVWNPDVLTGSEQSRLIDFTAYNRLIAEYRNKEGEDAQVILQWVRKQLEIEMGSLVRMVSEVYGRGSLRSLHHHDLNFSMQGDLKTILTPAISQVLDSTYDSAGMIFNAQSVFDDTAVVNVINGIVKQGEFERGIKTGKEVDASRTFGPTLGIVRPGAENKLDLSQCAYANDLLEWIGQKSTSLGTAIKVDTLVKNFTGINGPNGKNYGLSKRLIQLYLLALVKEGKLRAQVQGRNLPVEVIDYANINDLTFNAALLDGLEAVEILKPPEGWEIIAPFAAILLENEQIKTDQEEAQIKTNLVQFLTKRHELATLLPQRFATLETLFKDLNQPNPYMEVIKQWQTFLTQNIQTDNTIETIRYALEQAFGYLVYSELEYKGADVDDFATRFAQLKQMTTLLEQSETLRAIARYGEVNLPEEKQFDPIRKKLGVAQSGLENLKNLAAQPVRLAEECLNPGKEAIEAYATLYLTVFDKIVQASEETRLAIQQLARGAELTLLEALETIPQLNTGQRRDLLTLWHKSQQDGRLFPAELTRVQVQRDLRQMPQPVNCPLTFSNAKTWLDNAKTVLDTCRLGLSTALIDKAALLRSPLVQKRLQEATPDERIGQLLVAESALDLIGLLLTYQKSRDFTEWLSQLAAAFRTVQVVKLRLADFKPQKNTYQAHEVKQLVNEFETYLQNQLRQAGQADDIILEVDTPAE
ncbi:MAG: hypothetical protein CL609_24095 [Anaerolineaceae bacterium]|nr:hypothetical protein [Anaerolineaceae bacterium]